MSNVLAGMPARAVARTAFDPRLHGFAFINSFPAYPHLRLWTPFGALRIGDARNGLCGGMVFAALDYFYAGQPVPAVSQPPAGDALFGYLVRRLYDSFNFPLGVWAYVALMRPSRAEGAHSRAWRTLQREWPRLRARLEAGAPCPLGLVRIRSGDLRRLGENHQVLAYGYEQQGSRVSLLLYDPNYGRTDRVRLTFDLAAPEAPMTYSTGEPLLAFFGVRYRFCRPPALTG